MLHAQKMRAALVYLLVTRVLQAWNFTGSPMGLPVGQRHQNRVHNCTRSLPTLPGSAEAHSSDAGGVFVFSGPFPVAWGGLGSYLFVPDPALWLGRLKGQDTHGWSRTTRCIYPLPWAYSSETSQGVSMDSLGVGAVEIGRIFTPDHRWRRQEAPKRVLGDAGGVLGFSCRISAAWGPLVSPLFVPGPMLLLGGLKRQDTRGWFLTTRVFWHSLSLYVGGVDGTV